MKRVIKIAAILLLVLTAAVWGCRERFVPPVISATTNYLVVDGIINSGSDSTIFKLSRTVNLNNKVTVKNETKAKVTVESDASTTYPLTEIKPGTYANAALNLNKTAKYRLRIVTADSKTYLSDFVEVRESPPIDSVSYRTPSNGLYIYANTHDAANKTRYYRWEYVETWNFRAAVTTEYIASVTKIVPRTPQQQNNVCWASNTSSDIVLGSSAKLTNDVISNSLITTVPAASEKVRIGYSILVKQYALTEEAFNFWQNLKKNTELLGSIFDAQPSEIKGNIHNVNDASEPVFGYVSAGTMQQKRLSLFYTSWPRGWGSDTSAYNGCHPLVEVLIPDYADKFFGPSPEKIPVSPIIRPCPPCTDTVGYTGSSRLCVDCTLRGTKTKPDYWPFPY